MYSFFDLSSPLGARLAAGIGALIISAVAMATVIIPASPAISFSIGAMA
jgi:hypothetical protein